MLKNASQRPREQLRQPRVAEMVAEVLRNRILSGALRDGDMLPKQEELLEEFGVSKPSIREALRILETEGLITVQRGNVGGARVYVPQPDTAAYTLSLVLQSRAVSLEDVGAALQSVEPICARLCAERPDRRSTVVPALNAIHEEGLAAGSDRLELTRLARRFHEVLVESCGNETIKLVVGVLESLWSAHEQAWAQEATEKDTFPSAEYSKASLAEHAKIVKLIDEGDGDAVARVARKHLEGSVFYAQSGNSRRIVSAAALRGPQLG